MIGRLFTALVVAMFLAGGILELPEFGDPREAPKFSKRDFLGQPSIRGRIRGIVMQAYISKFQTIDGELDISELQLVRTDDGQIEICVRSSEACFRHWFPHEGSEALSYWVGLGEVFAFTLVEDTDEFPERVREVEADGMILVGTLGRTPEYAGIGLDDEMLVDIWRHIDYGGGFAGQSFDDLNCSDDDEGNIERFGMPRSEVLENLDNGTFQLADETWVNHDMDTDFELELENGFTWVSGMPSRLRWIAIEGREMAVTMWECTAYQPQESADIRRQKIALSMFRTAALFRSFARAHPEEYGDFVRKSVDQLRQRQ